MRHKISPMTIAAIAVLGIPWPRVIGQDTQRLSNQVQTHDRLGRLVRLDDYDSAGRLFHYQTYKYSPRCGTLELIDYSKHGTALDRLCHRGGPKQLPWRVYYYKGLSDLDMISEYQPVRNRRRRIIGWNEWIIYESARKGWLKKRILGHYTPS